jgi:hypothetical protein
MKAKFLKESFTILVYMLFFRKFSLNLTTRKPKQHIFVTTLRGGEKKEKKANWLYLA